MSHRSIGAPDWAASRYLPPATGGSRVWVIRAGTAAQLRFDCAVLRRYGD